MIPVQNPFVLFYLHCNVRFLLLPRFLNYLHPLKIKIIISFKKFLVRIILLTGNLRHCTKKDNFDLIKYKNQQFYKQMSSFFGQIPELSRTGTCREPLPCFRNTRFLYIAKLLIMKMKFCRNCWKLNFRMIYLRGTYDNGKIKLI